MGYYLPTWKASKINYIVDNHTMDLPPRMRIHNHISPNLECCECYISGSMPVDAASHESDLQTICWYLSSQLLEIQGVSNVELFFFGHPPKVLPAVQQALTSKQPEAKIRDGHAFFLKFAWGCFSEMYDKQIQNNSTFQCRTWESVEKIVYCLNCVVAELNWILNLYTCIILYQGVVNWDEGLRNHPAQPFQHWLVQMIICIMSLCFPSYFMQLGYERVTKIESLGRGFFSFHYRLPAPTC